MLKIRFQRVGRKNDPAFRVVVTERRSKPKGNGIELLGNYHPKTKATALHAERILYWMSKGAKPSPRVHNLLIRKGVIKGKKISVAPKAQVKNEAGIVTGDAKASAEPQAAEAAVKVEADEPEVIDAASGAVTEPN